jgi:hypothetical protein
MESHNAVQKLLSNGELSWKKFDKVRESIFQSNLIDARETYLMFLEYKDIYYNLSDVFFDDDVNEALQTATEFMNDIDMDNNAVAAAKDFEYFSQAMKLCLVEFNRYFVETEQVISRQKETSKALIMERYPLGITWEDVSDGEPLTVMMTHLRIKSQTELESYISETKGV